MKIQLKTWLWDFNLSCVAVCVLQQGPTTKRHIYEEKKMRRRRRNTKKKLVPSLGAFNMLILQSFDISIVFEA